MIGIKDIEVGKPYILNNTIIYVYEKISYSEYKVISIKDNISINYDDSIWFDSESYYRNDECFAEISNKEFRDKLYEATDVIAGSVIKLK